MRRVITILVSLATVVVAFLVAPSEVVATGYDSTRCRPDDRRITIPGSFFLDACFDGTYLVLINRSEIPVYVDLTGDLANAGKEVYSPSVHSYSFIASQWASHLLVPDYQLRVRVGNGGGKVSLGYADDTGRKYAMMQQAAAFAPSFTGAPDVISDWITESDAAFVQYSNCVKTPGQNFIGRAWCATTFVGDLMFANTRFGVNGVLTVTGARLWIEMLKKVVDAGRDLRDLNGDYSKFYGGVRSLTVPSGLIGGDEPKPEPSATSESPRSVESLRFTLQGSCTTSGGTITSTSSGFTPGGHYTIRAWRPDGGSYPLGTGAGGTVRADGSIIWRWPCAGDPSGTYATEVVDDRTGRTTGRHTFNIQEASQPPPPPAPRTWTEQQGSRGANTFSNPYNASGMGVKIDPNQWVEVSCKVYAPQIQSANPDGYWYRLASAPWNNQYYAVANTFWNGDVPGQTPYTHNTDFNVPDC